jgi:hypothetical protein
MPKASAARLAALVDDVHFATRLPKHLIMGGGLVAIAVGSGLAAHREGRQECRAVVG